MPEIKQLPKLLRLPNATADIEYSHTLNFAEVGLGGWRLLEITNFEHSGLSFNSADQTIVGTPKTEPSKAHEFTFYAKLATQACGEGEVCTVDIVLFVNPHPRSLWKEFDPDPGLPFQKPHRRSANLKNKALHAVATSVRGRSHANSGTFREDDFAMRLDPSSEWIVIAVSDGAGSAKLSRRGSEIASELSVANLASALPAIEARLLDALTPDKSATPEPSPDALEEVHRLLLDPVGSSAFNASKAIQAEASQLGFEEKAFSATLMLAAMRKWGNGFLVATYWIGDGAAVLYDPGTGALHLMGEADSGEYSGQTRFLLSNEFGAAAWDSISKRFRCRWVPAGFALVLMSDGVSDPKFGTENALKDPVCWAKWWHEDFSSEVNLAHDDTALLEALEKYLGFWSKGEHDDRTLALVYSL